MLHLKTYLRLIRMIDCLGAFLMATVGYWLSIHQFSYTRSAFLAALAVSTALAFGNVLNDVVDVQSDRVNYPRRPIPSGAVTLRAATTITIFCLIFSLLIAVLVGWWMLCFILFLLIAAAVYDLWASKIAILGNVIVASWSASTLATGYFVAETGEFPIIPILAAFCFILAREFIETISDDEGDRIAGRESIYGLWGKTRVLQICLGLVLLSALTLLAPLLLPIMMVEVAYPLLYLLTITVLLLLPAGLAVFSIWQNPSNRNIRRVTQRIRVLFFSSFLALLWLV